MRVTDGGVIIGKCRTDKRVTKMFQETPVGSPQNAPGSTYGNGANGVATAA